jgi:hypothetical protein
MKKTFSINLLLWFSTIAFSQVDDNITVVKVALNADGEITTKPLNISLLKLPIKLIFDAKFKGKNISITGTDNTPLAPKVVRFGDENLQKDGMDNTFRIIINKDRTVNPGDTKINVDNVKIRIDQNVINFSIFSEVIDSKRAAEPLKEAEYKAGYLYYDAMKLLGNNSHNELKKKILGSYGVNLKTVQNNPYLNEVFSGLFSKAGAQGGFGGLMSNLGNADVTNAAAGFARFLAERTKEELNEAFFNKMKDQLNAFPELKTVFPKTVSYLNIIESFSYASVLNALRGAFEMDIQNLPENLYSIKSLKEGMCDKLTICGNDKDCHKYADCKGRISKLEDFFKTQDGHWLALGMFAAKKAIKSTNPAELLHTCIASVEFTDLKASSSIPTEYDDYNIASAMELTSFISQSFVSKEEDQVWITSKQLKVLFNSREALKIYFGLLLAKELSVQDKNNIAFFNNNNNKITFGDFLKKVYNNYAEDESQLCNLILNTYEVFNTTNLAVKKMLSASEKSVQADPHALYDYFRTLINSIKPVTNNPLLIEFVSKDIGASYNKIERYLNPSADIAYHIATQKYAAAVYDASILLNSLNDIKVTIKKNENKVKETAGFAPVLKSFVKYGTLISTVANAQSSSEVKQALEASVLPIGSYSIKRKTNWSMSINSYVGAYWSYANKDDYLPVLGLSAPVGFNISKGISATGNYGGFGLNLQILDVGALVNYYLLNGDTTAIPNDFSVRLSNIFAPGFNLCYNIPKTPLSFSWGGQYIPTIYKYKQINGSNQLTPTNAFRMQFSLLVDIPMYNLKVWNFKK